MYAPSQNLNQSHRPPKSTKPYSQKKNMVSDYARVAVQAIFESHQVCMQFATGHPPPAMEFSLASTVSFSQILGSLGLLPIHLVPMWSTRKPGAQDHSGKELLQLQGHAQTASLLLDLKSRKPMRSHQPMYMMCL